MAVVKKDGSSIGFNDTDSQMSVKNIQAAIRKLDERLDILENYGIKVNNGEGWKDY